MPANRPDTRQVVSAARRGMWAATRPVVLDSRGSTVTIFDSRTRLWRDPPGLDFPQKEFRRAQLRLRRELHRPAPSSPGWSISLGVVGAVVILLVGVFAQFRPVPVLGVLCVWIVVWKVIVGAWVTGTQARRTPTSDDALHPPGPIRRRHPWHDWLVVYSPVAGMIVSWTLFAMVFVNLRGVTSSNRQWFLGVLIVYAVSILYAAITVGRKHTRTFPPAASELQIARALLAQRRCPTCAYSLRGVEPADDGCLVCPECASAWHPSRVDAIRPVFNMGASDLPPRIAEEDLPTP